MYNCSYCYYCCQGVTCAILEGCIHRSGGGVVCHRQDIDTCVHAHTHTHTHTGEHWTYMGMIQSVEYNTAEETPRGRAGQGKNKAKGQGKQTERARARQEAHLSHTKRDHTLPHWSHHPSCPPQTWCALPLRRQWAEAASCSPRCGHGSHCIYRIRFTESIIE